jgi:hypothetical protein
VELQPIDGGPQVRLRVSDTGVGLPADFESRQGKSLGLKLVSNLVQQIGGQLEIGSGPGAQPPASARWSPQLRSMHTASAGMPFLRACSAWKRRPSAVAYLVHAERTRPRPQRGGMGGRSAQCSTGAQADSAPCPAWIKSRTLEANQTLEATKGRSPDC